MATAAAAGVTGAAVAAMATAVAAGVTGGTVGVVGTLIALEIKKKKVQSRSSCPYCTPGPTPGRLACAECLGTGLLLGVDGDTKTKCVCPRCNGRGTVVCVNCKGDGRALPTILDAKVSRDPETEMEEVGMG